MNALRDDPGRSTNVSLFDEIRMSFNISRLNLTEINTANTIVTTATQTDDFIPHDNCNKDENRLIKACAQTQTDVGKIKPCAICAKGKNSVVKTATTQTDKDDIRHYIECDKDEIPMKAFAETQTENQPCCDSAMQTEWNDVIKTIHKTDLGMKTDSTNENEIYCGGDNAQNDNKCVNLVRKLDFATSIQDKSYSDEIKAQYTDYVNVTFKVDMEIQTESLLQNDLCVSDGNVQFLDAEDHTDTATQTVGEFIRKRPKFIKKAQKLMKLKKKEDMYRTAETQTDKIEPCANNNNAHCVKCLECDNMNEYTDKLERDWTYAKIVIKEMETKIGQYEINLACLEKLIGQRTDTNIKHQSLVNDLRSKIEVLESACETQRDAINKIVSIDTCCKPSQTEFGKLEF